MRPADTCVTFVCMYVCACIYVCEYIRMYSGIWYIIHDTAVMKFANTCFYVCMYVYMHVYQRHHIWYRRWLLSSQLTPAFTCVCNLCVCVCACVCLCVSVCVCVKYVIYIITDTDLEQMAYTTWSIHVCCMNHYVCSMTDTAVCVQQAPSDKKHIRVMSHMSTHTHTSIISCEHIIFHVNAHWYRIQLKCCIAHECLKSEMNECCFINIHLIQTHTQR